MRRRSHRGLWPALCLLAAVAPGCRKSAPSGDEKQISVDAAAGGSAVVSTSGRVLLDLPDGSLSEILVPAQGSVDLWRELETRKLRWIEAKGIGGSFVQGDLDHRGDLKLTLLRRDEQNVVELRRGANLVAQARGVDRMRVAPTRDDAGSGADAPVERGSLIVSIEGREPVTVTADEIEKIASESRGARRGAHLLRIITAQGVKFSQISKVVVQGEDEDRTIEPTALTADDDLRIGSNRRGELRFVQKQSGSESKIKGVKALLVTLK